MGKLVDLLASMQTPYPPIVALAVKRDREAAILIPWEKVQVMAGPVIVLKVKADAIVPYIPSERDLFLARDILDKQVIDINGLRVVRVNDLELTKVGEDYHLINVDIGWRSLLRRLEVGNILARIFSLRRHALPTRFIA